MPDENPTSATVTPAAPAAGTAAVPPAAAPAPPATPAPVTVDAMLSAMDDQAVRDRFFAEMRRSGRIKGAAKPAGTETTTTEATAPAPKAPDTEMVSRADLVRERAFTRSIAIHGQGLTERQIARMERSFETEKPGADAVGEWVAGYIADLGIKPTAAVTTATQPVTTPAAAPVAAAPQSPVTNVGSPAAPSSNDDAIDYLALKPAEANALIERIGVRKFNDRAMAQMKNRKVTVTR